MINKFLGKRVKNVEVYSIMWKSLKPLVKAHRERWVIVVLGVNDKKFFSY